MRKLIPLLLVPLLILAACEFGGSGEAVSPETIEELQVEPADEGTDKGPGPVESIPILTPEPREITIQTSDGRELMGYYYPAAVAPAPVVVLMHWVGGDMSDYYEIAPWLQNRGLDNPFENPGTESWWDKVWFPAMLAGNSYAVVIFTFYDCTPFDAGCPSITPDIWLLDARAAMAAARELEGVDPARVVAIGSSIGADGAVDGCAWLNEQHPGSCQGALSLSPGGFLGIPYPEAVQQLGANDPATAAWCLSDENEQEICDAANGAGNTAFKAFLVPGGSHGNRLLSPGLDPLPIQIIIDFLGETVGP